MTLSTIHGNVMALRVMQSVPAMPKTRMLQPVSPSSSAIWVRVGLKNHMQPFVKPREATTGRSWEAVITASRKHERQVSLTN